MNKFETTIFRAQVLNELNDKITFYEKMWLNLEWSESEEEEQHVIGGSDEDIEKYRVCEDIRKSLEKMI